MITWKPLGGKTRRYLKVETGETISRRAYMRIQGVIPERKAYERYRTGKVTRKPVSYEKVLRSFQPKLRTKWRLPKGVPYRERGKLKGYWQLIVKISRVSTLTGEESESVGYSKLYSEKYYSLQLEEAIAFALAVGSTRSGEYDLIEVLEESWHRWMRL